MLKSSEEVNELSKAYDIPPEDIMLISLNTCCMDSDMRYKRVRFKLELNSKPEDIFYFGIPVLRDEQTPFYLSKKDGQLLFYGQNIGRIKEAENDTCDTTYFRRNDTCLTLNSNSRSSCVGCAFCATHRQDATDKSSLDSEEKLEEYVSDLFSEPQKYGSSRPHFHKNVIPIKGLDFSDLHQVAVVTGCFGSEEETVEHIKLISKYFHKHGFDGEFKYIGSEITSNQQLKALRSGIKKFNLCLSLECFTRRDELLKNPKAKLTLDQARDVLRTAKDLGIYTNFTYLVGLDPITGMTEKLKELAPVVNRFPIFQVFQPHWKEHKSIRDSEANNIEYYLKSRKNIESIFEKSNLRPEPWENYRSLWYYSFADEPLGGIRI